LGKIIWEILTTNLLRVSGGRIVIMVVVVGLKIVLIATSKNQAKIGFQKLLYFGLLTLNGHLMLYVNDC